VDVGNKRLNTCYETIFQGIRGKIAKGKLEKKE